MEQFRYLVVSLWLGGDRSLYINWLLGRIQPRSPSLPLRRRFPYHAPVYRLIDHSCSFPLQRIRAPKRRSWKKDIEFDVASRPFQMLVIDVSTLFQQREGLFLDEDTCSLIVSQLVNFVASTLELTQCHQSTSIERLPHIPFLLSSPVMFQPDSFL